MILQDAFVKVDTGQIGLVITRGKPADKGLTPGMHFALRFGRVIEVYPAVEMAYLATASGTDLLQHPDALTYADRPLHAVLGDRAAASVEYTVRFRVTSEGLPGIHTRFGPAGIGAAMRDETRKVVINALAEESVGVLDAFGSRRTALEQRIGEQMERRLAECGFAMGMFSLRSIDLGETGAVIQAALRADEELALEQSSAPVRLARAQHEVQVAGAVGDTLSEAALEYLRIQVARELIQRWDGKLLALSDRLVPHMGGIEPPSGTGSPSQGAE